MAAPYSSKDWGHVPASCLFELLVAYFYLCVHVAFLPKCLYVSFFNVSSP